MRARASLTHIALHLVELRRGHGSCKLPIDCLVQHRHAAGFVAGDSPLRSEPLAVGCARLFSMRSAAQKRRRSRPIWSWRGAAGGARTTVHCSRLTRVFRAGGRISRRQHGCDILHCEGLQQKSVEARENLSGGRLPLTAAGGLRGAEAAEFAGQPGAGEARQSAQSAKHQAGRGECGESR